MCIRDRCTFCRRFQQFLREYQPCWVGYFEVATGGVFWVAIRDYTAKSRICLVIWGTVSEWTYGFLFFSSSFWNIQLFFPIPLGCQFNFSFANVISGHLRTGSSWGRGLKTTFDFEWVIFVPVKKLSMHRTSWPSFNKRSHKCDLRKPAARWLGCVFEDACFPLFCRSQSSHNHGTLPP